MPKAYLVRLFGDVQGVGMRQYVWRNAKKLGITGYVKNLEDGSVEILAQTSQDTLNKLLEKVKHYPMATIKRIEVKETETDNQLNDFEIH